MITDRDCDAPRELLLMADAHLWSVSGAGAGALLERNWDQSQVQTFMMLQYFDRKQAIPASQMINECRSPNFQVWSYYKVSYIYPLSIYMFRSKAGEKDIRVLLLLLAGSR